jgi:fatty acid synthase subunit alpha
MVVRVVPSMPSIAGLPLKDVEYQIKKTNFHLPECSQLVLSLCNGPRVFVVTGPMRSLYGLVINLRKIWASSGLDQNKTPFSQRKPVSSVRFLVVNIPYHSKYLDAATDKLGKEDLDGEICISPSTTLKAVTNMSVCLNNIANSPARQAPICETRLAP